MSSPRRPRGRWAALARAPVALYRVRLGWLLGRRFLMIVHRGRRTGRLRRTVVEVARFDPGRDEFTVVAAFGPRTDWYRNVVAHPALEVHVGCRRFAPQQRRLSVDEADAVLAAYERRHPHLTGLLVRAIGVPYDGTPSRRRELAVEMPMLAFRPRERADQLVRQKAAAAARPANRRKKGR